MATGEFLEPVGTIKVWEQVLARVQRLTDMDPKMVFTSATPGVIGELTSNSFGDMVGPWRGREEARLEIPGISNGAKAIGPEERMRQGGDDIAHIVALRGFELAGHTYKVSPEMFGYGGMDAQRARALAAKPVIDFNETVSKIMMDVMTSGDYSGSQTNAFAWSATDLAGNSQSQPLYTDTASEVENVYPYDTQTFTHWPMRDGSQAAAGHDHLFDTAAVWSAADAATQADNVREHPTNGAINAYVGSTIATAVQAAKKSDFAGISNVVPLTEQDLASKGSNFGFARPVGEYDGVNYFHMVDMPTSGALYVSAGKQPYHLNMGVIGTDGNRIETGSWSEAGDAERRGISYGYRTYVTAGVRDPLAATVGEHKA